MEGTTIFLRANQRICATTHPSGSIVTTSVVGTTGQGNDPSLATRATVEFEVTTADRSTNATQAARLEAIPKSIRLDNREFAVDAEVIEFPVETVRLQGSKTRDAGRAAIGGAVGALAGQLIGRDARSTVTGAAIGVAVGGVSSVVSANRDACVPLGAQLAIRLRRDVLAQ